MDLKNGSVHRLDIAFKGERNYVQGPDIAQALLSLTGPVKKLMIQFHKLASHQLHARNVNDIEMAELRGSKNLCGIMVYQDAKQSRKLIAVNESIDEPIMSRQPYDESKITAGASITGQQAFQNEPGEGNFFERTVAINKLLLNTVVEVHPWVFSRMDLSCAPVDVQKMLVVLKQEIGRHTYKSEIRGDDVVLGSIYFSRRPK